MPLVFHHQTRSVIPSIRESGPGPRRPTRIRPRWRAALVVALAIAPGLGRAPAEAQAPPIPREAIEQVIRDYLLSHPEVILESLRQGEARQREAARARARTAVQANREQLLQDPSSPIGGNPAGDVTVVEFFDYRCPHCRRMAPVIKSLIAQDGSVRLVYKELPILGDESVLAARAALAARQQGKYVEAHDRLMSATGPFTAAGVLATLTSIGLDGERLRAEMDAPEIATIIGRELALAQALGIDGTPAFVVGGELVVGAMDLGTLRDLVSRARRGPSNAPAP
jgi:protein-disulfide isomerase